MPQAGISTERTVYQEKVSWLCKRTPGDSVGLQYLVHVEKALKRNKPHGP
jgi:hypothetical protein